MKTITIEFSSVKKCPFYIDCECYNPAFKGDNYCNRDRFGVPPSNCPLEDEDEVG